MFIGHNELLGNNQEIVEEVEQQAILDEQVEKIKHRLNDKRDDLEDDIEHTQIELFQLEYDQQNDGQSINFRPLAEEKKDDEENKKLKQLERFKRKQMKKIFL